MLKGDENIFSIYFLPLLLKVLTGAKGNIHESDVIFLITNVPTS